MNNVLKIAVVVLLVAAVGLAVFATREAIALKTKNTALQQSLEKTKEDLASTNRIAFTLPYDAYSMNRLSYEPDTNMLYIPELKVRVPYTAAAKSLLYAMRSDELDEGTLEADVITDNYVPPQEEMILNCTHFLRLKIEDNQSPYNPAEKATSFKLGDGRVLQVYYFTGELEGNDQCKKTYEMFEVYPKDFVNAFKGVESY